MYAKKKQKKMSVQNQSHVNKMPTYIPTNLVYCSALYTQ